MDLAKRIGHMESILRDWLEEPAITLVCGTWSAGSIMELLPAGRALLTKPRYPEPFSGLRDIHLEGQGHHLHIDLAKLATCVYTIAPSVCYGYRPSFEVHFHATTTADSGSSFAVNVRDPYRGHSVNHAAVVAYFRRMLAHHARHPEVVRFRVEESADDRTAEGWREVRACLAEAASTEGFVHSNGETDAEGFARAVRALFSQGDACANRS